MKKVIFTSKMIIAALFVFTFIAGSANASSQTNSINDKQPKYSLIKVFVKNDQDMKNINREGLVFDHAENHSEYIETWLSESEIDLLRKSGVGYETVIADFEKYFNEQHKMTPLEMDEAIRKSMEDNNVSHSIYGTMGGFLTFNEVVNKLDSMRMEYPNLISEKFSIGSTLENREMWTVRVSNNPNVTTGRPEVWFHSMIHAREPMSMEQNIYFIYWLLENYNTDPVATYIMNNRELYFTPVFNPDGYEYNRSTNPTGGGMWRKNRRVNTGGSFGVDLNRNYGTYALWNSTNNGSSTSPTSDTYRGTSPFSEPETQNAMNFVISRNFKGILSYHTYGNYLIRPWGYVDAPSPGESIFQSFSQDMVLNNHFTLGRSNQTVGYGVRGVTDDWYYSDSAHGSAIAMTPEVGTSTDGFWPLQTRIVLLAASTLSQNIYFALSCGSYTEPTKSNLDKEAYNPGDQGNLKVYFKNKGLMNAQNVKIELISQNPSLSVQTGPFSYSNVASFASDSLTFNFTVSGTTPVNSALKATLIFKQENTNTVFSQDVYIPVGGGSVILLDSAENGLTKWTAVGGWGISTTQSYSPTRSFADSPTGNYSNTTTRTLTLITPLNVTAIPVLKLSYWYKHTIDTLDNAYIDVSNDNGVTWNSAKFYSKTVSAWTREVLDISSLANGSPTLKIRFSMISNGSVAADGIYIDDIKLTGYSVTPTSIVNNNVIPSEFSLLQNYPNPFNPVTVIRYSLNENRFTTLKIFNVLGREVASLVNENQNAGSYSVNFNGANLSSGMYFYKLESGEFVETKKMLLIK
ncbi:MAG: T9SS type A sorting domain-containing protein [Ignavibacteria bacterium]|nr:T9SS type A sorting domain-containing protein [Ignavibacteria bacterium]